MTKRYIMFWKDLDWRYDGDILLYDTISKKEEIHNKNSIFEKFPVPPPHSMWGTPFGHFSKYDLKIIKNLSSYNIEKTAFC